MTDAQITHEAADDARNESILVYVDGRLYTGDPNDIELTDQKEIAIVLGTPPATIPSTGDFSSG